MVIVGEVDNRNGWEYTYTTTFKHPKKFKIIRNRKNKKNTIYLHYRFRQIYKRIREA